MKRFDCCLFGGALFAAGVVTDARAQCDIVPRATLFAETDSPNNGDGSVNYFTSHTIVGDRLYTIEKQAYFIGDYSDGERFEEHRLQVWDISDLGSPVLLSESAPRDSAFFAFGRTDQMVVIGTTMFGIGEVGGLLAFDISDPVNPVLISNTPLNGRAIQLYSEAGLLYVNTTNPSTVVTLDITNPAAPSILGAFQRSALSINQPINGRMAAVRSSGGGRGILLVDATDPGNIVGSQFDQVSPSPAFPGVLVGDVVVANSVGAENFVVDFTDPANPVELNRFDPPDDAAPTLSEGPFVYYRNTDRVYAVSFLDPNAPVVLAEEPLNGFTRFPEVRLRSGVMALRQIDEEVDVPGRIQLFDVSSCALPPTFLTSPASRLADFGGPAVTFSVLAENVTDFQWFRDGVELADGGPFGGTQTADLAVVPSAQTEGVYTVRGSNFDGVSVSNPAFLGVREGPSCPADQNFDGMLDGSDFNAWLFNFAQGCP